MRYGILALEPAPKDKILHRKLELDADFFEMAGLRSELRSEQYSAYRS
jgi:hypothetical protein